MVLLSGEEESERGVWRRGRRPGAEEMGRGRE